MKGEAIGRGDGETGMGVPCSLDCFLLSRDIDIFEDPRKLGCLPSPGRADCLTCYPGSVGLSGARDVQAADVCEAGQPGASHTEAVWDADFEGIHGAGVRTVYR